MGGLLWGLQERERERAEGSCRWGKWKEEGGVIARVGIKGKKESGMGWQGHAEREKEKERRERKDKKERKWETKRKFDFGVSVDFLWSEPYDDCASNLFSKLIIDEFINRTFHLLNGFVLRYKFVFQILDFS
jgi:hypothetical protein